MSILYDVDISKQKRHGIVYTPDLIVNYILDKVFEGRRLDGLKVCDPAVGTGNFLFPAVGRIYQDTGKGIPEIIENQIFGFDIDGKALSHLDEHLLERSYQSTGRYPKWTNLFCGNSTDKEFLIPHLETFDIVVGNPPYVRIQNIPEEERVFLKDWECEGDCDLYTAFIRIGLALLKPGGVLGFITANSYLKNKSTTSLIDFLFENRFVTEICDFGQHHMFPGVAAYSGILICRKQKNSEVRIRLTKDCFEDHLKNGTLNLDEDLTLEIKPYPLNRSTFLVRKSDEAFIEACEGQQYKLKNDVRISVGLATLTDNIFFLRDPMGIEPEILRPCIKVSRLRNEGDVENNKCKIIFPYDIISNKAIPWTEERLQSCPNAYTYLKTHQDRLRARDKGKGVKYQWFHYGRSQGLTTLLGRKLLTPPMVQRPRFIMCEQEDLLFLSGYAIFQKVPELNLNILKTILESDVFCKYLHLKSKSYQGGYKACTKTLIQNFSVPHFTPEEKAELQVSNDRNTLIERKYG